MSAAPLTAPSPAGPVPRPGHSFAETQPRETFNPYMQFVGAFVGNWLAARKEITQGAKLAYGFLCQHAGKQGHCHPRQQVLAAEIGVGERQLRAYLEELESAELIGIQQRGLRRANCYVFYRHPWMKDGPRRNPRPKPERKPAAAPDRKPVAGPDRNPAAAPLELDSMEVEKPEVEFPHRPPLGESVSEAPHFLSGSQAEAIYLAYPRKVGRPAALRAIRRALKQHAPDYLLERTSLFAATYTGEARYIPNPTTWFNQARFNDDPITWRRDPASATPALRAPAVIRKEAFKTGPSNL